MKALVLAAGYATRLYPITKEFPKPLLEVNGKPIVSHIIEKFSLIKEIDEVFIITNNKFYPFFKKWSRTFSSPKKITLINDLTKSNADRLGAIGDINFALKSNGINDDLLIVGGDNLFSGKLDGFVKFAKLKKPNITIGVYRLKNIKDASRYGVVKIDKDRKVTEFYEKPAKPDSPLVAMCLYYIPSGHLRLIKKYVSMTKKKKDATGKYIDWIKDRINTYSYVFKGKWYDIGDHKYLNSAKRNFA